MRNSAKRSAAKKKKNELIVSDDDEDGSSDDQDPILGTKRSTKKNATKKARCKNMQACKGDDTIPVEPGKKSNPRKLRVGDPEMPVTWCGVATHA